MGQSSSKSKQKRPGGGAETRTDPAAIPLVNLSEKKLSGKKSASASPVGSRHSPRVVASPQNQLKHPEKKEAKRDGALAHPARGLRCLKTLREYRKTPD